MNSPRSIEAFRSTVYQWTWEELRTAMVDFDRYSDPELKVMREECDRRGGDGDLKADRATEMRCARCETVLSYAGAKHFHEGTLFGIFGDLGEILVNQEKFVVYFCPRCGKVEFFVAGIAEKQRPE